MENVARFDISGHPFVCPNDPHVLAVVKEVLSGAAYPAPEFMAGKIQTVVDMGANVGASALWLHARFPKASIHCFEPTSLAYGFLERNTRHLEKVECHNAGILGQACTRDISVGGAGSETSSLKKSKQADFGRFETAEFKEALPLVAPLVKTAAPLALKIDTEGCEVDILQNLKPVLGEIELLMLEYHSEEDRVEIDALARASGHILFSARADQCHVGTVVYLRRETMRAFTSMDEDAIR